MAISIYPFRFNTRRVNGFRVVSHLMVSILCTDGERPSEAAAGGKETSCRGTILLTNQEKVAQ